VAGRVDHLEKMSTTELGKLEVKTLAPARITGTIDRKVFPEIGMIRLFSSNHDFPAKISADGKSFEIADLPPGRRAVGRGPQTSTAVAYHMMRSSESLDSTQGALRRQTDDRARKI
jgi:hypothetical protein